MPWMLSTVLLLLALQGSTSADRQREELPTVNNPSLLSRTYAWLRNVVGSPYIVPTSSSIVDDTGETILNCSLIFDSIGPFCQYVISTEPESGICRSDFSMKTYSSCLEVVQECESPDNKKSICLSDLVPLCKENSEIDQFFIDYCSVVECVCNGESSSGGSASGSGSGSESGSGSGGSGFSGSGSGSGVEPTVIPTTGSPGPSTTEPTTTISTTGTTSSTTIPTSTNGITITTTTTAVDTGGTFVTTTATVTPFVVSHHGIL